MVMRASINITPTNTTNEVPNRSLPPRGSQINCEYTDEQIVALQALLEQYESELDSIKSDLTNLKEDKVKLAQKIATEQAEQGRLQKECYEFANDLKTQEKLLSTYVVGTLSYERQLDVVYELRSKYESCVRKSKVNETKYNTLFITQIYDSNEYEGDVNVYGDPDWDSDVELLHDCGSMNYVCPELENTNSVEETITKDGVDTLHTVLINITDGENINNIECCQSLGGGAITDDSGNVYCSTGVIEPCYPPTVFPGVYEICDEGGGTATFNLTLQEPNVAPFNPTATFEWFEDAGLTTPIPDPTSYVSSDDTVYVKVTSDVDCYSTSSLDLVVNTDPTLSNGVINFDGDGSAPGTYDLLVAEPDMAPFDYTTSTFEYFEDAGLTISISNPSNYVTMPTTVYVKVTTDFGCVDTTTLTLTQVPTP